MYTLCTMSTPWEIDPTTTDRDGAGAEGGAMGGDSAGDSTLPPPLQPPEDIDRTNPFQPPGASTPYPPEDTGETIELSNMDLDEIGVPPVEVPLLTDFLEDPQEEIDKTNQLIKDKFPKVDFSQIDPMGFGKKQENQGELVTFGKGKGGKYGETRVLKKRGRGLLKAFTDKFKDALGPSAEELIAKDNQEIRELKQRQEEAERQLKRAERIALSRQKATDEVQKLGGRLEQVKAQLEALEEEQGSNPEAQKEIDRLKRLKQNLQTDLNTHKKEVATATKMQKQRAQERIKLQKDVDKLQATYSAKVKERNEIEAGLNRTKTLDEMEERYETLKRANEEDQRVIDDENATSSDKQAAEARMEERREELERLEPQIQQREEALPLRERVKNIFKKYGWTLQAVVLAVGVVLGALALAGLNGIKAGTKAVGKGLKTIGQKLGSLLPGLIGSIVSFIFKAAGQVLSFLGEHAWLLMLAVVAFFMERLLKKRRKQ